MDELKAQIIDDLKYLRETWNQDVIDDNFLRRDSTILRRLLIDGGGGLLRRYRKQMGARGDVRVEAVDLNEQLVGLDAAFIKFASAGGARHSGMQVAGGMMYGAAMSEETIRARDERGLTFRDIPLSRYLDSPCLVIEGTKIRRRDVIQYIANKKGGVHYDTGRDRARDKAFQALDRFFGTTQIADKEAVYFELLAIGQALVAAPEIAAILDEAAS
jgi:hypothetical protein